MYFENIGMNNISLSLGSKFVFFIIYMPINVYISYFTFDFLRGLYRIKNGIETDAVIISIEFAAENTDKILLRYNVNDKELNSEFFTTSNLKQGDVVKIYYDEKNPTKIEYEDEKYFTFLIFSIFLLIAIFWFNLKAVEYSV